VHVLILGAGFGGLELACLLDTTLGTDVEVTLVDRAEGFVFGFSKLDVMFGRVSAEHVLHRYADLAPPGVSFVNSTVRSIDPVARRVETEAGPLEGDVLVVALGADLHPEETPEPRAGRGQGAVRRRTDQPLVRSRLDASRHGTLTG
jgi:sulfide:quinone oxidoreductase